MKKQSTPDNTDVANADVAADDSHIPVGTPPGGGQWTWSAESRSWVSVNPVPEPVQTAAE